MPCSILGQRFRMTNATWFGNTACYCLITGQCLLVSMNLLEVKGTVTPKLTFFFKFQWLLILIEDIVTSIKKNQFTMKIDHATCIWMFVYVMNFELPEMAKKWSFGLFRPNLPELGLFHPYFLCKSSFRVISMIKMLILDQSKTISLYLKIKNKKVKNPKFVNCAFIINKNGNKAGILPILLSNSTSFIFNNIFCGMKGKNVLYWMGGQGEWEPSKFRLGSVILVYSWISKYITWISKYITWISKYITWISK